MLTLSYKSVSFAYPLDNIILTEIVFLYFHIKTKWFSLFEQWSNNSKLSINTFAFYPRQSLVIAFKLAYFSKRELTNQLGLLESSFSKEDFCQSLSRANSRENPSTIFNCKNKISLQVKCSFCYTDNSLARSLAYFL